MRLTSLRYQITYLVPIMPPRPTNQYILSWIQKDLQMRPNGGLLREAMKSYSYTMRWGHLIFYLADAIDTALRAPTNHVTAPSLLLTVIELLIHQQPSSCFSTSVGTQVLDAPSDTFIHLGQESL